MRRDTQPRGTLPLCWHDLRRTLALVFGILAIFSPLGLAVEASSGSKRKNVVEDLSQRENDVPSDGQAYQVRKIFAAHAALEQVAAREHWKKAREQEEKLYALKRSLWREHLKEHPEHANNEAYYNHEVKTDWYGWNGYHRMKEMLDAQKGHVEAAVRCTGNAFQRMPIAHPDCLRPEGGTRQSDGGYPAHTSNSQLHKVWAEKHLDKVRTIYADKVAPRYSTSRQMEIQRSRAESRLAGAAPGADLQSLRDMADRARTERDTANEEMARHIEHARTHAIAANVHYEQAGVSRPRRQYIIADRLQQATYDPIRSKRFAPYSPWHQFDDRVTK